MYTKSISLANSEPCGGIIHARTQSITYVLPSYSAECSCRLLLAVPLEADHPEQEPSQNQERQHASGFHEIFGEQHVLVFHQIVEIADQQYFIDSRRAPVLGSFRKTKAQVQHPIVDPVKITRHLSF